MASSRPSEPNSCSGFPVTTPGENPSYFEYSSMIHAITSALVFTSGAGMSMVGPITSLVCSTKARVTRSSSKTLIDRGSQSMPPLAPPKGTSTMAVFQVIRFARAAAWSSSIVGW